MLTNLFHSVATGSATQILGSSRELASLGHHVVVITAQVYPSTPDYEVTGGFKISRVPALRLSRMSIALNFPWLNWTFWPGNLRSMEAIISMTSIFCTSIITCSTWRLPGWYLKRALGIACMEAMLTSNPVPTGLNVDTFGPGVLVSRRDAIILDALEAEGLFGGIIDLLDAPEKIARIGSTAHSTQAL